jgi:hypothetical protein
MIFILRDDLVLEVFDTSDNPPNWIEPIDIENEEYSFCDDHGQRYGGCYSICGMVPRCFFRAPSSGGTGHCKCYCARRSCGCDRT